MRHVFNSSFSSKKHTGEHGSGTGSRPSSRSRSRSRSRSVSHPRPTEKDKPPVQAPGSKTTDGIP